MMQPAAYGSRPEAVQPVRRPEPVDEARVMPRCSEQTTAGFSATALAVRAVAQDVAPAVVSGGSARGAKPSAVSASCIESRMQRPGGRRRQLAPDRAAGGLHIGDSGPRPMARASHRLRSPCASGGRPPGRRAGEDRPEVPRAPDARFRRGTRRGPPRASRCSCTRTLFGWRPTVAGELLGARRPAQLRERAEQPRPDRRGEHIVVGGGRGESIGACAEPMTEGWPGAVRGKPAVFTVASGNMVGIRRESRARLDGGRERGQRRAARLLVSKAWIQAAVLVILVGFFILGLLAYRTYIGAPAGAGPRRRPAGARLFTGGDISPARGCSCTTGSWSTARSSATAPISAPTSRPTTCAARRTSCSARNGGARSDSAARRTIAELRANRYDERTGTLRRARPVPAFRALVAPLQRLLLRPDDRARAAPRRDHRPRRPAPADGLLRLDGVGCRDQPAGPQLLVHEQLAARAARG